MIQIADMGPWKTDRKRAKMRVIFGDTTEVSEWSVATNKGLTESDRLDVITRFGDVGAGFVAWARRRARHNLKVAQRVSGMIPMGHRDRADSDVDDALVKGHAADAENLTGPNRVARACIRTVVTTARLQATRMRDGHRAKTRAGVREETRIYSERVRDQEISTHLQELRRWIP